MPRKKVARANGKTNKSAAIRAYLDEHKRAKPRQIVAAMKEQGIEVSSQIVSTIKTKYSRRRKQTTNGAQPSNGSMVRGRPRKSNGITVDQLIAAKALA